MLVAALALQLAASTQAQVLVTFTNTVWKYLADGTDQGTDWRNSSFDDSAWPSGRGLFGDDTGVAGYNAVGGFATTINGTGDTPPGPQTAYYRVGFNWSGTTAGVVFTTTNYIDDGFVMYLNGTEILRFNITADPVAFSTGADAANPAGEGNPVVRTISLGDLPVNPLVAGANVLAVEVHQTAGASSDHVWGMFLRASQVVPPCADPALPADQVVTVGRPASFQVVEECAVPAAAIQWFRNVGFGEELIIDATNATYSIAATASGDAGVYYARLTNIGGSTDTRQATLTVDTDSQGPRFVSARIGATPSQLIVDMDESLCNDPVACGFESTFSFNWQISSGADTNDQPGILLITLNNGTNLVFDLDRDLDSSISYFITVIDVGGTTGVADFFNNTMEINASINTFPTVSFQQGINGYAGTQDAEIHSNASADLPLGTLAQMGADLDDAGFAQSLIRFENIFGPNPGQIPSGVIIRSATLTVNQIDPGSLINIHRMLVPWGDQGAVTWNSVVDGVANDDAEAVAQGISSKAAGVANGLIRFDVTESLIAWAAGAANNGWVFLSSGTDGWDVNTSESGVPPILSVEFEVTACVGAPSIVTQPPTAVSANEKSTLNVSVGVSNACDATFTWLKGELPGTPVSGQNSSTLSIPNAAPGDSGVYRLQVANPNGTVTSGSVNVTIVPDTTRPTLTRAVGPDGTQIVLTFSETLGAGADSTSRYTVSGATVTGASVANNVVTLTTTPRAAGSSTVTITGLTDTAATPNMINPNPTMVSLTTVSVVAGADAASTWFYNTNNLDANADWTTTGGEGWFEGNGIFGTETSAGAVIGFPAPIATVIPPPNVNNEFLTSYYRKTVTLPALPAGMSYALSYIVDDGAIFYVDGVEISRYNMGAGVVTYSTLAPAAGPEGALFSLPLPITSGTHTIAVSVHQSANTSSDIVFGAEIIVIPTASPALTVSRTGTNAVITWNADATWELVSSANVNGPWAAVAGAPFRSFTAPATQAAQFYQLRYRPLP